MKIQIDTINKTVKIESTVLLSDLIDLMRKLFPDGDWKEWHIEANSTIYWTTPYVYPYRYDSPYRYDYNKWTIGSAYRFGGTTDIPCDTIRTNCTGIINIEMNENSYETKEN